MTTLFHDMMHREIEVYVDYMIAKSLDAEGRGGSGLLYRQRHLPKVLTFASTSKFAPGALIS